MAKHLIRLVGLLSICFACGAHAQTLCLNRPISFAHYEFGLLYSEGYGGIDDDIQKELARRSGCKFTVSLKPRARIWSELEVGALDMAGSGVQTAARDQFAWFAHYVFEDNHMILSDEVPARIKNMDDFLADPSLLLGGVISYSYSPFYDKHVAELMNRKRFSATVTTKSLYEMFALKRFDAFLASQFLSLHYFRILNMPVPKRIEDWDPAAATPSGLVVSKKSFTEAQGLGWQALIQQMLADGTVRKIVKKHMGKNFIDAAVYTPPKNPS